MTTIMRQGKHICETLKSIRREIAEANEIDYQPTECTHEGDCAGTCPKCESETRWLERQLRSRQALGKAVTIAGLSVALGAMSSCHPKIFQPDGMIMMPPENGNNISAPSSTSNGGNTPPSARITAASKTDQPVQLMGDVVHMPDSTTIENQQKNTKN